MTTTLENLNKEVDKGLETHVEIQIKKEFLQGVIRRLDRSREKKDMLPIRQGMYLYFNDRELVGRAMNGNYSIEVVVPRVEDGKENFTFLSGKEGGAVFTEAKFVSMVNGLPRKNIRLDIEGSNAILHAGRSRFEVHTLDHLEFPRFMDKRNGVHFTIHADVLKRMYNKTVFACSTLETRPILTGISHEIKENKLLLVSTDSHRLARIHEPLEGEVDDTSVVIPSAVISEVVKQLDDNVQSLQVYFNENSAIYELDNGTTIFSRLINGNYPDTSRLIPNDHSTMVQFNAGELKELIQRAMIVDQQTPLKMLINANKRQARIISREADRSGFVEDISPLQGEGHDIKLGFNVRYLYDALSHQSPSAKINIEFINNMRPFIIRAEGMNEQDLDLILPVRLGNENMDGKVVLEDFQADQQTEALEKEASDLN